MGIGLSNADWYPIVQVNREARPCVCTKPENSYRYCTFHGYMLNGGHEYGGIITTTDMADKFIKSKISNKDDKGRPLVSTERGKRRRERLGRPRQ